MPLVYPNWAYDPKFNSIFNRKVQRDIDDYVFRHPTEILLTLADVRASGSELGTPESLGELFCLLDDLLEFRRAYGGPALRTGRKSGGRHSGTTTRQRRPSTARA